MKTLQTLGKHAGQRAGVFEYKRSSTMVTIDASVSTRFNQEPNTITLHQSEWSAILAAIESAPNNTFRLTTPADTGANPSQSLYDLFSAAVPSPQAGWHWNDSYASWVAAVLEHEGSIDLFHGALGPQAAVVIALNRDIP